MGEGGSCEGASRWVAGQRRLGAGEQWEVFILTVRLVGSWLRRAADELSPLFLPCGFWKRVTSLSLYSLRSCVSITLGISQNLNIATKKW